MERQVKERLVGAAVLVAAAVILIPELLSGPGTKQEPTPDSARNEQGLKTYEFKLDGTPPSAPPRESNAAPPAEQPAAPPAEQTDAQATSAAPAEPPTEASAQTALPASPAEEPSASTPSAAQAPTVPPSTVSRAAMAGWAVQLGSFADEDRAKRLVAKLKDAGHNAYLVPLRRADGKTLQRVRIGPYAQRAAADAALKRVTSEAKGAAVVSQP